MYYLEKMDTPGVYNFLTQLQTNNSGLVRFPDSKDFFNRYGPEDKGGENNGVKHGKGDHYLNPDVAAALFGLAAVLKDSHGITMSFGDMSAENGTDPYTKGGKDHLGHGHDGRSGLDIDFRYVDKDGNSFQGRMDSATFDKKKNQTIYDTAKTFGFIENYQGKLNKLTGVETEDGHNNHGHLGFNTSSATIEYSKKHLQTK